MRIAILLCILVALSAGAVQAQTFSSLEERMSAAEFSAAGLDKLSPAELARLNAWLEANLPRGGASAVSAAPAPAEDRRGLRDRYDSKDAIISRIDGDFTGWDGGGPRKTRFILQNGQIWEQIDTSVFVLRATDPVVTIEPAMFDSWVLRVEGHNQAVRVKRVR
jgi:hypothetical protein